MNHPRFVFLVLATCAVACGGREDGIGDPIALLNDPIALDEHVVLIDNEGDRAFLVDITAPERMATPQVVALPHDTLLTTRRNGANEGLILSKGRRASTEEDAEPAVLTALSGDGKVRRYELGNNPFDSLKQSSDGRFAFLFKSMSSQRLLDNPNEVAIIDLSKAPGKLSINLRTLRSFGDSPSKVIFSPPMNILDEERRLAVVLSDTNVTLIDLTHLNRLETTVQLSRGQGQPLVEPEQVLFNPNRPELYVRGASSNDIFVFTLAARASDDTEPVNEKPHNDFRPSIDQLGVGGLPSDMALYETADTTRLLVLSAETQQASIVDTATSQITSVSLPLPATDVLLFDAASPRGDATAPRALLYQPGGNTVLFLDLEELETRGSRNLEPLRLSNGIAKVIPLLEQARVLVLHADGQGVSLIDLAARTVSPITSNEQLTDATFDPKRLRLWVGPSDQSFVSWLDLQTGDTQEVLLDAPIAQIVPMLSAGKIAILHDSDVGHITVIDATKPERATAHSARGFLISGLLN